MNKNTSFFQKQIQLKRFFLLISLPLFYLSACHSPSYPSLQGEDLVIPDKEGWILINYWAEWCHPCLQEIPEINQLALKLPKPLVAVYGIYFDPVTNKALMGKIERYQVNYTMLSAEHLPYPAPLPNALPANYLMDSNGNLHGPLLGPQTEKSIMQAIQKYSFVSK